MTTTPTMVYDGDGSAWDLHDLAEDLVTCHGRAPERLYRYEGKRRVDALPDLERMVEHIEDEDAKHSASLYTGRSG